MTDGEWTEIKDPSEARPGDRVRTTAYTTEVRLGDGLMVAERKDGSGEIASIEDWYRYGATVERLRPDVPPLPSEPGLTILLADGREMLLAPDDAYDETPWVLAELDGSAKWLSRTDAQQAAAEAGGWALLVPESKAIKAEEGTL